MKSIIRATTMAAVSQRELAHAAIARRAAAEGIVLLKNENSVLPLKPGPVALYGAGARRTLKGGVGSGEVRERTCVSIEQGLENAGFVIKTKRWLDDYDRQLAQKKADWKADIERQIRWKGITATFRAVSTHPFRIPTGRLIDESDLRMPGVDTAIYVIARQAGEGKDRKLEPGDFYLDETERANLQTLVRSYQKTIVVLNAGGMIDLGFLEEIHGIGALVYFGQGGQQGGSAFADVVCGAVGPSGKLTDTWGVRYEDYPASNVYGASRDHAAYPEGIFVGYRYFDAFGVEPRYPFGFGLSYAEFSIETVRAAVNGSLVDVTVAVKNTGAAYAGKEVVQVYLSAPDGALIREPKSLAAFEKTQTLQPGERQEVTLAFDLADFAVYDAGSARWLLEGGTYFVWVGNSSRSVRLAAVLELDERVVTRRVSNICSPNTPVEEITPPQRKRADVPAGVPRLTVCAAKFAKKEQPLQKEPIDRPVETLLDALSDREMILLVVGGGLVGWRYNLAPGAAGATTSKLVRKGIPNICMADGPAGLHLFPEMVITKNGGQKYLKMPESYDFGVLRKLKRLFVGTEKGGVVHYQYATAWPVETMLAQSWNTVLLEEVGAAVGKEMLEFGVTLWLAPGMNIHRNPLCGRNFEYYSEDPVLTGGMAAALTRGVQRWPGVGVTIKHFVCNHQENDRMQVSSDLSERALREIYLKGFEIAVRQSSPMALMTSYNRVNGVYTANSYDLCTAALRTEWGFRGVVMTDWSSTGDNNGGHALCIPAGNDLIMPGNKRARKEILKALRGGQITREQLRACARRVLTLTLQSNVAQ
ncbi:MAG TPA: glycoside hydrolase family 3 C-terminal domain-containing protein [Eubacteriales bacterium]|nr:glycoside hydrolase family 3 C-terminal domain-containing protein [Eubacteriales bacterium]